MTWNSLAGQPGQIRFESKLIVEKHLMRTILCLFSAPSSPIIVIFYTNFMRADSTGPVPCTTPHLQTIIIRTAWCLVLLAGTQYTINTPLYATPIQQVSISFYYYSEIQISHPWNVGQIFCLYFLLWGTKDLSLVWDIVLRRSPARPG